jgi:hypothetical protein
MAIEDYHLCRELDRGRDAMTVREQNPQGASDEILLKVCACDARVLTILDHDVGQAPPSTRGAIGLRAVPRPPMIAKLTHGPNQMRG